MLTRIAALLVLLGACVPAWAGEADGHPGPDPIAGLRARVADPTEVLVLASEHLAGMEGLRPSHLDRLHAGLASFAPKAIVVEAMADSSIDLMVARPRAYEEVTREFVGPAFLALARDSRRELALSADEAGEQLAVQCEPLPVDAPGPLSRCLRLAAAAHDRAWFGYIAWQYHRRHASAPLPGELGAQVAKVGASTNENHMVAARLADALGLARLHGMDYQPGQDLYGPVWKALMPSASASKAIAAFGKEARMVVEAQRLRSEGLREGDLLPLYAWINTPDHGRLVIDEEWRNFVDRDLEPAPALARLAVWDVRNLEMMANVLRVATRHPGERVLVLVGASHKVFFDKLLEGSIGVRVRQLDEFIAE